MRTATAHGPPIDTTAADDCSSPATVAFRAEREVFYGADWFEQIVIDVPQGEHIYEFTATTDEDPGSPLQLDPFFCDNP